MNVDQALKKVETEIKHVLNGGSSFFSGLYSSSALSEGKRLRGKLFFVFSGIENEYSVRIAAAIELLHAATLIHDDILDNSKLRRGNPPLYIKKNIPLGLLYGDYLFSSAFSLISRLKNPLINMEITRALSEVLKGEILEQSCRRSHSLSKKRYFSITEKKSGVLFGIACKLGAYTRGMSDDSIEKAYRFGLKVGMVYQIIDDCFDYFVSSKEKESFNDFKQGIMTLPLIYLLKKCGVGEKKYIKTVLGREKPGITEARKIVLLMKRHEVMEDISKDVDRLLMQAESSLSKVLFGEINDRFDILSWLNAQIDYVKK